MKSVTFKPEDTSYSIMNHERTNIISVAILHTLGHINSIALFKASTQEISIKIKYFRN